MSQDDPNIQEILTTVREFAEGVAARTQGAERYDALCAAFLMGVVLRELQLGEAQDSGQRARLQALLGCGGDLKPLYREFSARVRRGDFDRNWQQAFDFAFEQVLDKVRVTNPNHLEVEHR